MEGTLRVTPEKLRTTSADFATIGTDIQTITTNMTETVNNISGSVWSGEAATAYITKFNGLQDDINKMIGMVREHSNDLIEMATAYETANSQALQAAESLATDVIS